MATVRPFLLPARKIALFLMFSVGLLFSFSAARTQQSKPAMRAEKPPVLPEYICLDPVVRAVAPDGRTVFPLTEFRPGECQDAVMPSPLSAKDRDLFWTLHKIYGNVDALQKADQILESGGKKGSWGPLIAAGVADFQQTRKQLCSEHPDMFIFQLEADGERTAPEPCSKK